MVVRQQLKSLNERALKKEDSTVSILEEGLAIFSDTFRNPSLCGAISFQYFLSFVLTCASEAAAASFNWAKFIDTVTTCLVQYHQIGD